MDKEFVLTLEMGFIILIAINLFIVIMEPILKNIGFLGFLIITLLCLIVYRRKRKELGGDVKKNGVYITDTRRR